MKIEYFFGAVVAVTAIVFIIVLIRKRIKYNRKKNEWKLSLILNDCWENRDQYLSSESLKEINSLDEYLTNAEQEITQITKHGRRIIKVKVDNAKQEPVNVFFDFMCMHEMERNMYLDVQATIARSTNEINARIAGLYVKLAYNLLRVKFISLIKDEVKNDEGFQLKLVEALENDLQFLEFKKRKNKFSEQLNYKAAYYNDVINAMNVNKLIELFTPRFENLKLVTQ